MTDIKEILAGTDISTKISLLKNRSYFVPEWRELVKDYEPEFHDIVNDRLGRKDKTHSDGSVDKAARLTIGLEKLLVKRMTEFTFAIPPKRVYYNTQENETRQQIADALEAIYKSTHINTENIKRGIAYYASCEIFTIWYAVKKPNNLYGFPCENKLKCKTYSPMDGCKLYPLFDEMGDMLAMSFEYERKVGKNDIVVFFETYTEEAHYKWKRDGENGSWVEVNEPEPITILKIPGAYLMRRMPVYAGLQPIREDLEYSLSRNSDIVAYNAAPVLKVAGQIIGDENKGETRRVYRVEEGGDVSYVSWAQSNEALKYHVDSLLKFYWMQAQMPDISFENMKSLGDIGYDSRRTLLTDAHLKIGEESGPWMEFLSRECNVIKAFLKKMQPAWEKDIDEVEVEHIITPFIIEDEQAQVDLHMKANGGQPVESLRESIQRIGKSKNVEETIKEIIKEQTFKSNMEAAANVEAMTDMFSEE